MLAAHEAALAARACLAAAHGDQARVARRCQHDRDPAWILGASGADRVGPHAAGTLARLARALEQLDVGVAQADVAEAAARQWPVWRATVRYRDPLIGLPHS